jgi:hypothetical protein
MHPLTDEFRPIRKNGHRAERIREHNKTQKKPTLSPLVHSGRAQAGQKTRSSTTEKVTLNAKTLVFLPDRAIPEFIFHIQSHHQHIL